MPTPKAIQLKKIAEGLGEEIRRMLGVDDLETNESFAASPFQNALAHLLKFPDTITRRFIAYINGTVSVWIAR